MLTTPISGTAQKVFYSGCWGEAMFQIWWRSVENWAHNAGRSRRLDGHRTDGRTDAKVVLYSVQCCTLHWTDKNVWVFYFTCNQRKTFAEMFFEVVTCKIKHKHFCICFVLHVTTVLGLSCKNKRTGVLDAILVALKRSVAVLFANEYSVLVLC